MDAGAIKVDADGPRPIRTEGLVPYVNCRPDCDFQSGFNFEFPNGKTVENGAIKSETDGPRPIRTESLVPYVNCRPDCDFQSGFGSLTLCNLKYLQTDEKCAVETLSV